MSDPFQKGLLDKIEKALNKRAETQEHNAGWGSPIGGDWFTKDNEPESDVPYLKDVDTPYKTHFIPGNQESDELLEQNDEEEEEAPPEEVPAETGEEVPSGEAGADPAMGEEGMGMPGGEMGMPGEEPPKDPKELGRTYELKKIYARLISIESYLATSSDEELLKLRNYVSKSIEMFQVLSSNIESFKDSIDEIIVIYYDFINTIYGLLEKHYKLKSREEKKNDRK